MNAEIQSLTTRLEQLEQANQSLNSQFVRARRRYRVQAGLALVAVIGAILVSPTNRAALAAGGKTVEQRLTALETKTQFQNADSTAKSTTFSACNLIVNNGLGATNGEPNGSPFDINSAVVNGLGNLIVGYNEQRTGGTGIQTGSHNIIAGVWNNYSSFGGLMVGYFGTVSAPYASAIGGQQNTASGAYSLVGGGQQNIASGFYSSVCGGIQNLASANYCSVSGGSNNTASSNVVGLGFSSVSGGSGNTASGPRSSVSGGSGNTASGDGSSVSGGLNVTQSATNGWSGGSQGIATSGSFNSP